MGSNAVVLAVGALALGVTAWAVLNVQDRGLLSGGEDGDGAAGRAEERLAAVEQQTAEMTAAVKDLREVILRIDRRTSRGAARAEDGAGSESAAPDSAEGSPDGSPRRRPGRADAAGDSVSTFVEEDAAGTGGSLSGAAGDAVAARIEKRIEQVAARERARGADGKWKAPIPDRADELGADAAAKAEMGQLFDDGRDQVCRLLLTQRSDGGSLLDDFAADLKETGDGQGATQRFFKRLMAEQVPGRDETYLAAAMRVHTGVEESLSRRLGAEQMEKLRTLHVDLLEVQTGHDPVGDALRERLQK